MLTLQSFDFIWIGLILWGCRPRKEWPAYFTLAVNDFAPQQQGNNGERAVALPPSLVTNCINDTLLNDEDFDIEKNPDAIGDNDAVIIINPTKYTLEPDDYAYIAGDGEKSAFDPDMIVAEDEEAEEKERIQQMQETKKRIREGVESIDSTLVKAEIVLGFRDQKQVTKMKKEKEKANALPRKMSLIQRMKSWGSNRKKKNQIRNSVESPLLKSEDLDAHAATESSSDEEKPNSNPNLL